MLVSRPVIYLNRRGLSSSGTRTNSTSEVILSDTVLDSSDRSITLSHTPIVDTVLVTCSGVSLVQGADNDYVVSGSKIMFNTNVPIERGVNIAVYYQYII